MTITKVIRRGLLAPSPLSLTTLCLVSLISQHLVRAAPASPEIYDFLVCVGDSYDNLTLRSVRIGIDDSISDIASVEIIGNSYINMLLGPHGKWVYLPYENPMTGQLFEIDSDLGLHLRFTLNHSANRLYEDAGVAITPSGSGFITSELPADFFPHHIRFFNVTPDLSLVPVAASLEVDSLQFTIFQSVISPYGNLTIFAQSPWNYRTYHLDPRGDIYPPTPNVIWDDGGDYQARGLGISADGRLIVSAGSGSDREAVTFWVDDNGNVTELDSLYEVAGSDNVLISPRRDWVMFVGWYVDCWSLNPDGTFGPRLWEAPELGDYCKGALSADGRCALIYAAGPPHKIQVVHLSESGGLESITTHTMESLWPGMPFAENIGYLNRDSAPPPIPTGLSAVEASGEVALTWEPVSGEIDFYGYRLFRSEDGAAWERISGLYPLETAEFLDSGLINGTSYSYLVRSEDFVGNLSASSEIVSATPNAPIPPSWLTATAGSGEVSLAWEPVSCEVALSAYRVHRTPGSPEVIFTAAPASTEHLDGEVVNGTTYIYAVRSVDLLDHASAPSAPAAATPSYPDGVMLIGEK